LTRVWLRSYSLAAIALAPPDFLLPNSSPVEAVMRLFSPLRVLIVAALFAAGCSSSPEQPAPKAPQMPANDTPAHAVQRFLASYTGKQETVYTGLFTKDFVFDFSNSTDPTLVAQYANGWVKNDELQSATHLFHGYTPQGGTTLPAATSIDIKLAADTPTDDNTPGLDPKTHKILATRVDGSIVVPLTGGYTLTYLITNNLNAFYFVRGDAATSLDTGQPADTLHWYVYRWSDLTLGVVAEAKPGRVATKNTTWAGVRASYRGDNSPSLAANETPQGAIARLVGSYERMLPDDYAGMFTGDFTYQFSSVTDPLLVTQYATGWFKTDEKESSLHLFQGYTLPGGMTLPSATAIDVQLATGIPTDDNSGGVDPVTHKILSTGLNGSITVPQSGSGPLTYVFSNNFNVFYLVRGDVAVGLDASQPADTRHWYVYKWVDQSTGGPAQLGGNRPGTVPLTWGKVKALYR
jgi:hypothetical protein